LIHGSIASAAEKASGADRVNGKNASLLGGLFETTPDGEFVTAATKSSNDAFGAAGVVGGVGRVRRA